MQTHHCICMINTEFMGSSPRGAAGRWGVLHVKGVKEANKKEDRDSQRQELLLKARYHNTSGEHKKDKRLLQKVASKHLKIEKK